MQKKEKLGREIKALDHLLMRNLFFQMRQLNLDEMTVMHGWIIEYLYRNREREIFQRDIEKDFDISRATVTNILKLMEKKGYIRREPVERDARLKRIVLLKPEEEVRRGSRILQEQLDTVTFDGITDEELETFYRVLYRLKENLKKQGRENNDKNACSAD